MTRKEWFDNQTPELQEKFKYNCNTINDEPCFDYWITNDNGTGGLSGAFVFHRSMEGHTFWYELNNQLQSIQQNGK
jgi:dihydroorotate dehydrogenase